ncbi:MAG: iron-containing alcohol dehydrogenase, partial [Armatimonadaceae bacterium]
MRFLSEPGRTRIVTGAGCVDGIVEALPVPPGGRILLVTDAGLLAAGHVGRLELLLRSAGWDIATFSEVRENPDTDDVAACLRTAQAGPVDAIVALGGGSSLDTAKGAALLLVNGGRLEDFWHTGKPTNPLPPLIAIPTTAGTGSEMQSFAIISDPATHRKMAIGTPMLAPAAAFLDPDLTASMPLRTASITGIDALSHALEAGVSTKTTAFGRDCAIEAWGMIQPNLTAVVNGSADTDARLAMLTGSAAAGRAIENGMLGAAHALANPLTAHFGLPHGQAVGTMLPHVIRFNAESPDVA